MTTSSISPLETEIEALLSEPIERAKQRARSTFDEQLSPYGRKVVLFGAGNMGRRVLARLRQDGIEPLAFSDNARTNWGRQVDGVVVLPPAEAAKRYGQEAQFIVTIYNHDHSFPDTKRQLTALGCASTVSVIPLRWKYHETFLPYYRDDLPHKVLEHADAVREGLGLWVDEASRREYVAQVHWRLHGDFEALGQISTKQAYFPEDETFRLMAEEFFVDVGAYDGDTLAHFLALRAKDFHRVLALEPDPMSFQKLNTYVAGLPEAIRSRIETKPVAASAHPGRLRFSSGQGTSSSLSRQGSVEVECCRLDDVLAAQVPTYIKMDIEGAELDAIHGARRTLSEKGPILAACVYHVQDHLWEVPRAILASNPDYHLFLRPYMPECWETVCYAVPSKRLGAIL
jgi:FkbM family methyltransferase